MGLRFFPRGAEYNDCTTTDNGGIPWCLASTVDSGISGGHPMWGNCRCGVGFVGPDPDLHTDRHLGVLAALVRAASERAVHPPFATVPNCAELQSVGPQCLQVSMGAAAGDFDGDGGACRS